LSGLERVRRRRCTLLFFVAALLVWTSAPTRASADDGYDLPFAKAVRAATNDYRLALWAQHDGYVQSTDYVANLGVMYTNHDRFSPPDLAHPTVLIFDQAGRLVACEYQFLDGAVVPAAFKGVPADAWFDIPRHVHFNVRVNAQTYFAQGEWATDDAPTLENLHKHGLTPDGATLLYAFVHPKTRAFVAWAWLPNSDGLFSGENALLP
jgi:hypothetical protein